MPRYANVDRMMEHAVNLEWSVLKWVNEVDIVTAINPNVVERKKGEWLDDSLDGILPMGIECRWQKCSCCGNSISRLSIQQLPNFCPNCGAEMREENDNAEIH